MPIEERPFWERHYGIIRGPTNRAAWRRLGWAWVVAVGIITIVAVGGALLAETA